MVRITISSLIERSEFKSFEEFLNKEGNKMTFIGFLAEKKDEKNFQKALRAMLAEIKIKAIVVAINEKNIENVKNIRFQTIIMDRNIEENSINQLKELLVETKYLIVNSDIVHMERIQNMNLTVITYGFGSKCTVTASSIDEGDIMFCLQRSIYSLNGNKVEPQEIKGDLKEKISNKYLKMALISMNFLYNF